MNPEIIEAIKAYVEGKHPYPFGSFVTALLANDLVESFVRADTNNVVAMHQYVSWLYNNMPGRTGTDRDIWGSYEAVAREIKRQQEALL